MDQNSFDEDDWVIECSEVVDDFYSEVMFFFFIIFLLFFF